MRKYLDGVTEATTASTERMQKMASTIKSKYNQLVDIVVRLDAKNAKVEELIARLMVSNGSGSGGDGIKANN